MALNGVKKETVLITGEGRLTFSIAACLLQSEYSVVLCTENKNEAKKNMAIHYTDLLRHTGQSFNRKQLEVTDILDTELHYKLVVAVTGEDVPGKKLLIRELERKLPAGSLIAVNTESIPLCILQEGARHPERVIGLNWTEPAHTTYFMEIIANAKNDSVLVKQLANEAKTYWGKDPYIISGELGIRAKMMAAMTREAFYLVEKGYASIEDIDRACRNDPGYYLPFAGNFRYIDLMGGAGAYGRVMKDLNPELSKSGKVPDFFTNAAQKPDGFKRNTGLYEYQEGDMEKWEETFREFSYRIKTIIDKYPFQYLK
ncbi:3-hydroxyacyl-CoA dehydrogenase NAD-binding domain-containing protein [Agriterribacter humi]|uniref:3-hydroxyacyl-CoA dehydrogenase NAD-binding domain-containing protein n=1 Tax=Agriterribacter humi TaxID=1104781 RepID=UPI0012656819|nr:3-hydroxyacyl-CoA dehydrogenase NAD-binding domain-containing protein [Agriterribacter humi]